MSEDVTVSFTVPPEVAQEIVDDIADAREGDDEMWDFTGHFDIQDAIEIQAQLQEQLREVQLAEEYESYDAE